MYVTWYKQELGEGRVGWGGKLSYSKWPTYWGAGKRGGDNTDFHRSNTSQTNFNPQSPFSFNYLDSLAWQEKRKLPTPLNWYCKPRNGVRGNLLILDNMTTQGNLSPQKPLKYWWKPFGQDGIFLHPLFFTPSFTPSFWVYVVYQLCLWNIKNKTG